MSRRVCVAIFGALCTLALPLRQTSAQSPSGRVTLTVTVPPQAAVERVSAPLIDAQRGDTTVYRVTVVVRANAPYRIIARRSGTQSQSAITLGVAGESTQLAADRRAVRIVRGNFGVSTFEVTYAVATNGNEASASPRIEFDALPDSPMGR